TSTTGSAGLVAGGSSSSNLSRGPVNSAINAATNIVTGSGSAPASAVFGGASAASAVFPNAGQVPLRSFSHVDLSAAPLTINHQGQFPVITISFNLGPGTSLGSAIEAVNKAKGEIGLPPSIQAAFQGTAEAFQASLANEWVLILAALVTVYIVLGVLYESY